VAFWPHLASRAYWRGLPLRNFSPEAAPPAGEDDAGERVFHKPRSRAVGGMIMPDKVEPSFLHSELVRCEWLQLANIAWRGHLTDERGVVFVDFLTVEARENGLELRVSFIAAAAEDELLQRGDDWNMPAIFFADLYRDALRYDPSRAIVVCVRHPSGEVTYEVVEREPAPPDAFLQHERPSSVVEAVVTN